MFRTLDPHSETATLFRNFDWASTSLGQAEHWPRSLLTMTGVVLESRVPMYLVWGPERIFIYNDAYIALMGPVKHPGGFGKPFREVWPEVVASVGPLMDAAERGERVVFEDMEMQLYRNHKFDRSYFSFTLSPIRNDEFKVAGVLCNCFETTARVESERALRESEENLRLSLYGARMGTWSVDVRTGETNFSKETAEIFGVTTQKPGIDVLTPRIHPDEFDRVLGRFRKSFSEGGIFEDEYRIVLETGEIRWINSRGHTTLEDGKPDKIFGILADITERKIAQLNFEKNVDVSPAILWITEADGQCTYLSKQWLSYTGQSEQEAKGFGWLDATHPDDKDYAAKIFLDANSKQKPFSLKYRLKTAGGDYRWAIDAGNPRFDKDGTYLGFAGAVFDVHEQVMASDELQKARIIAEEARDEAERANELKSAFLANMSHEIRTPLGAMMGFADLLRDPGTTPTERASYVDILHRNGESLSVIINDILDLSKVEAGHLTLEYLDTRADKIGADVVSLLRVKAKEKGLVLEYTLDSSSPAVVVADPNRVRQVLMNIVGNAIKFTQFGSVHIHSYGCTTPSGRPALCFEVRDTGIGIPEDQKDKVFEMFVQADGTMTRRFGGTGLGLALSRRLAREMGGDVSIVQSKEGSGTTFLIQIEDQPERRTLAEPSDDSLKPATLPLTDQALAGLKILVVDDAPDNQQLLWRYLTKQGAIVETAENGLLGYRAALSNNFDIVLMDIQMPVMDGYTATAKLREAGFQKPIIALTAHAMNEVRKKALNVGYTDHLPKPINPTQLITTIASYTRH